MKKDYLKKLSAVLVIALTAPGGSIFVQDADAIEWLNDGNGVTS